MVSTLLHYNFISIFLYSLRYSIQQRRINSAIKATSASRSDYHSIQKYTIKSRILVPECWIWSIRHYVNENTKATQRYQSNHVHNNLVNHVKPRRYRLPCQVRAFHQPFWNGRTPHHLYISRNVGIPHTRSESISTFIGRDACSARYN